MVTKVHETLVRAPVQKVWDFHNAPGTFKLLIPPDQHVEVVSKDLTIREGAVQEFIVHQLGLKFRWRARIIEAHEPRIFVDISEKGPFKTWKHSHEFIDVEGETLIRETVNYIPPGSFISGFINNLMVEEQVDKMLKHRSKVYREHLENSAVQINEELFAETTLDPDSELIS